jgi:hypothetical protein
MFLICFSYFTIEASTAGAPAGLNDDSIDPACGLSLTTVILSFISSDSVEVAFSVFLTGFLNTRMGFLINGSDAATIVVEFLLSI